MGYYDPNNQRKSPSVIFISLISAIIGGLVVALVLTPIFFLADYFTNDTNENKPAEDSLPQQQVGVKVNTDITSAVKKVRSSVVGVINYKTSYDPLNPEGVQRGTGSGIIFRKSNGKALVVTNHHVISGGSTIQVMIPHKNKSKTVDARVLGSDDITDLAVLEIDDQYVTTVAQFGNSATLQSGEPAIAIGSPLGLESSITVGVISSPKRTIEIPNTTMSTDVIQTDAAINPGNSGGPLVNVAGQVVGINTLKIALQGVEGLGFAIPVNDALPIIENLIKYGKVPRPYLGVSLVDLKDLPPNVWYDALRLPQNIEGGVVIRSVNFGTPASSAGLRPRDVIVQLDNQPIQSSSDLRNYLYKQKQIGAKITIVFYRNGQKQTATTVLQKAPDDSP